MWKHVEFCGMLARDRLNYIKEKLTKEGSILNRDMCLELDVSDETIRRDLAKLSKEMEICRVRGGAYLFDSKDIEVPAKVREALFVEEKEKIAVYCVDMISHGDTIALDSSTTALSIARRIKTEKKRVTIITNSINIVNELMEEPYLEVIALGGSLRKTTKSFIGEKAIENMQSFWVKKAFISCTTMSTTFGIADNNLMESKIRKTMIDQATTKYLIVDHTKFGDNDTYKICDLSDFDYIVIDEVNESMKSNGFLEQKAQVIQCKK